MLRTVTTSILKMFLVVSLGASLGMIVGILWPMGFTDYIFQIRLPARAERQPAPVINFTPQGGTPAFDLSFVKVHDCLGQKEYPYATFKLVNTGQVAFESVSKDIIDVNTNRALYCPPTGCFSIGFHIAPDSCGAREKNYLQPGETAYVSMYLSVDPDQVYEARATIKLCPPTDDPEKDLCAERSVDFAVFPKK